MSAKWYVRGWILLGDVLDEESREVLRGLSRDPRSPLVLSAGRALTREGGYGGFLGRGVSERGALAEFAAEEIEAGADVVKVILSGSVDFASGWAGEPHFALDEMRDLVAMARRRGVPVAAHANGDAAITVALRADIKADAVTAAADNERAAQFSGRRGGDGRHLDLALDDLLDDLGRDLLDDLLLLDDDSLLHHFLDNLRCGRCAGRCEHRENGEEADQNQQTFHLELSFRGYWDDAHEGTDSSATGFIRH